MASVVLITQLYDSMTLLMIFNVFLLINKKRFTF